MYRNILDVDGARALGKCLEVNKTLKFVDIGHNRIRITGLKAIVSGILANQDSKLSQLGVRANFINDDGFSHLFEKLVLCDPAQKQRLTHIFLKSNFLTEYNKVALYKDVKAKGAKVYVDDFENVDLLQKELLDRTIFMAPMPTNYLNQESQINRFFSQRFECGLVTDVRMRVGKLLPGRSKNNCFVIVEYAHENSVPRSLKLASKKVACFSGVSQRIYKAGTRTVVFKPSQKKR